MDQKLRRRDDVTPEEKITLRLRAGTLSRSVLKLLGRLNYDPALKVLGWNEQRDSYTHRHNLYQMLKSKHWSNKIMEQHINFPSYNYLTLMVRAKILHSVLLRIGLTK